MPRPCETRHPEPQYVPGEPFDPQRDCRLCWLDANDARYHALWDTGQPPPPPTPTKPPVGQHLTKLIEWLGEVDSGGCGCKKWARKMDRWGPEGCRANMVLIAAKLQKEAFARNIPMVQAAFIPLVELAIRNAEAEYAAQSGTS